LDVTFIKLLLFSRLRIALLFLNKSITQWKW